jgi:hypothetical protein
MSNKLQACTPIWDVFTEYLKAPWLSLGNDYSCTELLKPPKIVQLERKYNDTIKARPLTDADILGILKAYQGTAIHSALQRSLYYFVQKNQKKGYMVERKLWDKILDRKIVGKFDLWLNGALYDWKSTSVWKVIFGQDKDYEEQLNIYAYLLRINDVKVNILYIIFWLTDWDKMRASQGGDYPEMQIVQKRIRNLWDMDTQLEFLKFRIGEHIKCEGLPDDELPDCAEEDMWSKPDKFAVHKPKSKRAMRVLDTNAEAKAYILNSKQKDKEAWTIKKRCGSRMRCEQFCKVNEWCGQHKKYMEDKGEI